MKKNQLLTGLIALTVLSLGAYATSILLKRQTQIETPAALATADIFFTPASPTMPPDSFFKIMVDPKNQPLVFARVTLTFDPSKVQLISDITPTNILPDVISITTKDTANQSGQATLVLALPSTSTAPATTFELANFSLKSISTASATTALNFSNSDTQLVHQDTSIFNLNPTGANLTLNPGSPPDPTSAPTNGVTVTPAKTPTPAPTTIPTPTKTPTSIPSLTCTNQGGICRPTCLSSQKVISGKCTPTSYKCCK